MKVVSNTTPIIFLASTGISADFMEDGRNQPSMQEREPFLKIYFKIFPKKRSNGCFLVQNKNRGKIVSIEFTRQEPKKRHLSDTGLALDLLAQDELKVHQKL